VSKSGCSRFALRQTSEERRARHAGPYLNGTASSPAGRQRHKTAAALKVRPVNEKSRAQRAAPLRTGRNSCAEIVEG
jgi:hypothetical protein